LDSMKPHVQRIGVSVGDFINEGSCSFYGAPVAIIICLDDCFLQRQMVDFGTAVSYLVLAAHAFGLSTCPIGLIVAYEDEIKDLLNIPENKKVIMGIALGYPDWENPITQFKSSRDNLSKLVRRI
jgi:nitroreductase